MKSYKRILKTVAKNHRIDSDELLIALWDRDPRRFDYLRNENDTIRGKDVRLTLDVIKSNSKERYNPKNRTVQPPNIFIKEYNFESIGRKPELLLYLDRGEIIKIYEELVADFNNLEDPIEPSGIKDSNLLDSAVFHPQTSYEGRYKYPTVETSAAALMYALSHNHAFHNGNKRTAMVAMLVFLDRHNTSLLCNEDDLFKVSLKLADHKLVDPKYLHPDSEVYELSRWIDGNSKVLKKRERPIRLKKLKQTLSYFDAHILPSGKVQRIIKTNSLIWGTRERILTSKRAIGEGIADGHEVDKGLIRSIRTDLELNEVNGIDSDIFYEMDTYTISDFINKYKVLLRRLSKV